MEFIILRQQKRRGIQHENFLALVLLMYDFKYITYFAAAK
jgi:hypothetical protein